MKKWMFYIILIVCCCANENIEIKEFAWSPEGKVFYFSGRTAFPDQLKLKVSIILNDEVGANGFIRIKRNEYQGYFAFPGRRLLPGKYTLKITIPFQRILRKYPLILDLYNNDFVYTREYLFLQNQQKTEWQRLRQELSTIVWESRSYLDTIILEGHVLVWRLQGTTDEVEKQRYLQHWKDVVVPFPDYEKLKEILYQKHLDSIVIHPYASTVKKIFALFVHLEQLRKCVENEIHFAITKDKDKRSLPFFVLVQNIKEDVDNIYKGLDFHQKWEYRWDVNREIGLFKDHIYKSHNGFHFRLRNNPKTIIPGKKNSAKRLFIKYHNFSLELRVGHFPYANGEDELLKLWQLLALYEWNFIEKQGKFISMEDVYLKKYRRVYFADYTDTTDPTKHVQIALFFGVKKIYGLLYTTKKTDGVADENFKKFVETFSFTK